MRDVCYLYDVSYMPYDVCCMMCDVCCMYDVWCML